ncbi:MAG: beta-galactosidase [Opitutaceae bacterium]|jgi:hypothetical protein|nr:beta-galactosidase [Opitutaceae bacterium]
MTIRFSSFIALIVTLAGSASLALEGLDAASLSDAGFERYGTDESWEFYTQGSAQATASRDTTRKHGGDASLRLSSTTPFQHHVYGALRQNIQELNPDTDYEISLWVSGQSVSNCTLALGPKWSPRKPLPEGSYDWRQIIFPFKTPSGLGKYFPIVVIIEGPTGDLWLDDISIREKTNAACNGSGFFDTSTWEGIPPALRFYPAFPTNTAERDIPVLSFRSTDSVLGADARMTWDASALHLDLHVIDPTAGRVLLGDSMWQGDSVQLHIQVDSVTPAEIGFALQPNGQVDVFTWDTSIDLKQISVSGKRTSEGYRLGILIPWNEFGVVSGNHPRRVRANFVINDSGENGNRRFVEWTPATAGKKDPEALATIVLVEESQPAAFGLVLDKSTYNDGEQMSGRIIAYATGSPDADVLMNLQLQIIQPDGRPLHTVSVPAASGAISAGKTKTRAFVLPAFPLPEGNYQLQFLPLQSDRKTVLASTAFERANVSGRISRGIEGIRNRYGKLRQRVETGSMRHDSYIVHGLATAELFLKHFGARINGKLLSNDWQLLQINELDFVLTQMETRLETSSSPIIIPRDYAKSIRRNRNDYTYFAYGFGHWDHPFRDMPFLSRMGAGLVQREFGSMGGNPERVRKTIAETFARADQYATQTDFLLSPHYFPGELIKKDPTLALDESVRSGFIKFNIDHPEARRVIGQWVETVVPPVKDSPSLFSIGLSNEPTYAHSGRDPHSRPQWIRFLQNTHQSVDKLNSLYREKYPGFDDVPVPAPVHPDTVEKRRAYYDWVIFNQQNFADWHRWLNDTVKRLAPEIPTHAKVMPFIFERSRMHEGLDPELICEITDLAGNDCWAYWQSSRGYAYNWQLEEMWYDLLHSFRGQPVYNSENHLVKDGALPASIPPGHTYSVLWQGALHNQAATAIWVWQEPLNPALEGSIYLRPGNTWAAGRAMLDINRLGHEIRTIARAKAPVAILYSVSSAFWQKNYDPALMDIYTTLSLLGHQVTFISEKQLVENRRSPGNDAVKFIALPQATHVKESTVTALEKFIHEGGQLITLGDGNLQQDEYARPRHLSEKFARSGHSIVWKSAQTADDSMSASIEAILRRENITSLKICSNITGKRAWGIPHRTVKDGDTWLIALNNMKKAQESISIPVNGPLRDILNDEQVDPSAVMLDPMRPRLLRTSSNPFNP